ncbi:MAG: 5'-nucleotidase domain-containing protein, partial [Thermoanaerobaculia bacterium]
LAYFGRERLDREELKRLYRYEPIHPASARFYHLDSLFELPEANLYAELIDLAHRDKSQSLPSSWQIFDDLRAAVDWVHRHGALKTKVLANRELYLRRDVEVGLALLRLALNGRRLILLTNSDWEYVRSICSFLFDGLLPGLESWRDLFDLVIVEAGKPDFFRSQRPFEVIEAPPAANKESDVPAWGGVYRGGCLDGFMQLIGEPGEHVLYVGDHIYGDIVSSKLESTWRTALIVRELEEELSQREQNASDLERQIELQQQMTDVGHEMDHLRDVITVFEDLIARGADLSSERLDHLRNSFDQLRRDHFELLREEATWSERLARRFNPYWGSFFKQGTSKTRFASQLESYACLYTSRVSNFAYYGSNRYFRVSEDPMMHKLEERR